MNALFAAAKEVCDFMQARRWKFCIIGGLAVQRWGEPRATLDKAFASRTRDWLDAEGIVARQERLDGDYIIEQLSALCELKETPEILDRAKRILAGRK